MGSPHAGDLLGRACRHDSAAATTAFGTEIDHPIGVLHDVEVVFHNQHGVAGGNESLQHGNQLSHIGHVETGGGLIQNVERAAGGAFAQFAGQFDALRLASGEGG